MKNRIFFFICLLSMSISIYGQIIKSSIHTTQPEQYSKVEVDIELMQKFNNPYMQEEAALDMLIVTPSGKEQVLPCYFVSEKERNISCWKARYAPQESGLYQYKIQLTKKGKKKTTSKALNFEVVKSKNPGFLHAKSDWILEFDNGCPFRGIGENICWESRDEDDSKFFKQLHEKAELYNYDYLLTEFAKNGGNFFRTWMCSWNLPIDYKSSFNNVRYTPSDEYYNPSALARMDYLVELSESLDLYIMLTLGQGGYLTRDRGVVDNAEDFFVSKKARAWYKNRLRYIVARWGYSTSIAMWEFFNEVDNVQFQNKNNPIDGKVIADWHDEMSTYMKQIDLYRHIVTTSISHRDIEGLNSIKNIDINQKHIYNNTSSIPAEIERYVQEFGKPYIIGEFSREWDWSKNFDDFSHEMDVDFKRGVWYGLFSPTPVTPMSWWWEYFDARGLTPYYRKVREVSDRMLAAGRGSFESLTVKAGTSHAFGVKCGEEIFVYLFNPEHATLITNVIIPVSGGRKYKVQAIDPTMLVTKDILDINYTSSSVNLKEIILGAEKEVIYILTPLTE
ncbi:DUF5060 domain-containing protein [Bacteroides oleiciplenus]|uniref:DUF5060 domain-containing protein n=2 Tax=Bacteroides oleiciplenus TaxID=626931 RepID=K9DZM3_9BACE|nr:DUF5060 domain-containing protein [Bacteroides oleiciplenus]EKU90394.1 hypothetical protein HMPREF9447_01812 [Bacteroides oleiciplenus YIT 12058]RGN39508.1 DUF5060 domain-containing protein [Bacteroides oleiciplenus]